MRIKIKEIKVLNRKFKHFLFDYYLPILLVSSLIAIGIFWYSSRTREDLNMLLVGLGGFVSFFYFVQKQQNEEMVLFAKFYQEFNSRYDKLNENMNRIATSSTEEELSEKDIFILFDYFNLCSEEYLYYTRGYIYPEVWKAWCNGIHFFLKNEKIQKLWKNEEKNAASYYGLTLEEIKSHVVNKAL